MKNLEHLYEQWAALQPMPERKRYLLEQRFIVDYNFNSNHIEGNTLTYGQTEMLLLLGKVYGEGDLKDYNDMRASQACLEMVREAVRMKDTPLTQNFIRQLHKVLLREDYVVYRTLPGGVQTSYTIHAGQYKTRPNSVITRYGSRFEYASPEETSAMMSDLVDWYNAAEQSGKYSPEELAALFHYRYIRIHPFEDGNGRIARLLSNFILARHLRPMIVIRSRDKGRYLEALHRSDLRVGDYPTAGAKATLAEIHPFVRFFTQVMMSEIQYNIDFATETSPNVWWHNGEKIVFRSKSTPAILKAIKDDPDITIERLSKVVGIALSAVNKQLGNMVTKGFIQRRESDNSWFVFASQSL